MFSDNIKGWAYEAKTSSVWPTCILPSVSALPITIAIEQGVGFAVGNQPDGLATRLASSLERGEVPYRT